MWSKLTFLKSTVKGPKYATTPEHKSTSPVILSYLSPSTRAASVQRCFSPPSPPISFFLLDLAFARKSECYVSTLSVFFFLLTKLYFNIKHIQLIIPYPYYNTELLNTYPPIPPPPPAPRNPFSIKAKTEEKKKKKKEKEGCYDASKVAHVSLKNFILLVRAI